MTGFAAVRKCVFAMRTPEKSPDLSIRTFATDRRFAPLFATQFCGAFNDNLFKTTLFVMISYYGLGHGYGIAPAQMLNLGMMLFILPYFLFSAASGQLGTRFGKAALARVVKIFEILIMLTAAYGFVRQSLPLLFVCLFLMGSHSTLFGPLKYAVIPEYLNDRELILGNSLIESGTFIAILFGQIFGTILAGMTPWAAAVVVVLIAALGFAGSLYMPSTPPQNPQCPVDWHLARGTRALLLDTFRNAELKTAIIGLSWFWFLGSVYTTQLPTLTQIHLGGNDHVFNLVLTLFSVGIAAGSVVCAKISHRLHLGAVLVGAVGLTVSGLALVWLTYGTHYTVYSGIGTFLAKGSAYPIMLSLTAIGFFGGFFSVPLYTRLQTASSNEFRAQAVAANNIVNGLFMIAAALISLLLLTLFNSIVLLYLIVALGNIALAIYLCRCEPKFFQDITALVRGNGNRP